MKRLLIFSLLLVSCVAVNAGEKKLLRGAIAVDQETKPATSFAADVPKLYAFFIGDGLTTGDKLRGVWIAEDVGEATPKNTQIDETTLTVSKADQQGAFSLTKPTNGWPIGKYRVEMYLGEKLAETVKFTIGGKAGTKDDDEAAEESADE